jgi:ABC-type phosphate/phosphonate transport system substrate-binding protein
MATKVSTVVAAGLAAAAALLVNPGRASAQESYAFIGVALDRETRQADRQLVDHLQRHANVRLAPDDLEYERAVERLVAWRPSDGFFLSRTTPYVYLAAEMLGAELDVLGTYVSARSGQTTYSSYFVVRREYFTNLKTAPTLFDVERFLKERTKERPARSRFVYHNSFSTSSYFLPSLFFRARKIFSMPEDTESLFAIASDRAPVETSSKLVELVASGQADIAAVWDAAKSRFEEGGELYESFGKQVYFVPLTTLLPNDLLVCSARLDRAVKDRLRAALKAMPADAIKVADFQTWKVMTDVPEARLALADLRWLARERPYPVTVEIQLAAGSAGTAAGQALVEAAKQAVRLAGTELVVYDRDFHERIDFAWTLEPIHDGAVLLRSAIPGSELADQVHRLSFRDPEDLSKRLVTTIASRLHRIRYVWPYSTSNPTVIRDLALWLPEGSRVRVQKVTWLDPERNRFRAGPLFDATIKASGFHRYELDPEVFSRQPDRVGTPDAMSNVAYRVILIRADEERLIFRALTGALLALFAAGAVAAVWDLRRTKRQRPSSGVGSWA